MIEPRVYCQYPDMLKLKTRARGFSFLAQQPSYSLLAGRHQSTLRGRGLNFEELRHYHRGDDIRTFDWKVTLRTGQPHVRSYTEERDRNVILVVDQRTSMFFSTQDTMKSVVALELAAISAWRILEESDRVGGIYITNERSEWFKPERHSSQVMRFLKRGCEINQTLKPQRALQGQLQLLNAIKQLNKQKTHDSIVILYTDFFGWDPSLIREIKTLQRRNDVIATFISDPIEQSLPAFDLPLIASDGLAQIEVRPSNDLTNTYEQHFFGKCADITQLFQTKPLPLVRIGTDGEHLSAFREALTGGPCEK